jgi:DNA-binding transcriptional ArsR family regulator
MVPANGVNRDSDMDEFQRLLGKKGSVRVLEVFLGNREIPVTRSGLEKLSGMSQPTVSRTVEEFLEIGIIEESKDDSPKMFRLNMEHPGATGLISAYDALYAHVNEIQEASEEFDPNMAHSNEGSPFVELFRYPTNGALLSELLRQPDTELTAADIARAADVDPSTVGDNIPILVRIGVVDKTESGRHDQYQLNRGHPAVEGFLKVIKEIQDEHSPREPTKDDATERAEETIIDLQSQLSELLEEMDGSFRDRPVEGIDAQEDRPGRQVGNPNVSQQARATNGEPDEDFIDNDNHTRLFTQASNSGTATAA